MKVYWFGRKTGNVGDLLSPIILAAYSGQPIELAPRVSLRRRLVSVGTIGDRLRGGTVDVWGSGFAAPGGDPFHIQRGLKPAPLTRFVPHALRGPLTGHLMREAGYPTTDVYGDPVWLLPRIWPSTHVEKKWDLGVVMHISEVIDPPPAPFPRYEIPASLGKSVVLLNTLVDRSVAAVRKRVEEILSCRRILSLSLHAQVIAETYGIPCATFDFYPGESGRLNALDDTVPIDHRMRDFYAGIGKPDILTYRTERHLPTDWEAAIRFLDERWEPAGYDPHRLLDSFPAHLGRLDPGHIPPSTEALAGLVPLPE